MFGLNLFYIDEGTLEILLRHVFRNVSYNFDDRLRLRALECVDEAFSEEDLMQVIAQRGFTSSIMDTNSEKPMKGKADLGKTHKSNSDNSVPKTPMSSTN